MHTEFLPNLLTLGSTDHHLFYVTLLGLCQAKLTQQLLKGRITEMYILDTTSVEDALRI
jgi:hypothetical protein